MLETAQEYDVPLEMLWKPSGSFSMPQTGREPGNPSTRVADSAQGAPTGQDVHVEYTKIYPKKSCSGA